MIWQGSPLGFTRKGSPVAYDGNAATLIFGPPGSSKTVGVVVNQLLDEPGRRSFVVIDPKGEVAAITARYRRRVCGAANVKIINPYGLLVDQRPDLKSDRWNPLGDLDATSPTLGDECAALADALIKPESNTAQKHFPDAARSAKAAGIKQEVKEAAEQDLPPSLPNVRALLTQDGKALKKWVAKVIAAGDYDVVTRLRKFLADTDELENIKSTIETATAWMTENLRADMVPPDVTENGVKRRGGVSFRACTERPTTIYVLLPTQELQNKAVYLRLVLSAALRALYCEGGTPTTLLIEEGFVIGHHAEILQALSILRGFGHRMTIVFQSLQQIKSLYADTWGLFMGGAVLGFRPADLETAEWMSKRSGEHMVPSPTFADPATPADLGVKPSWGPQKRERIRVGKMFGMPQGRALVWLPSDEAPRVVSVRGYFDIPKLARRADPNPYFKPDWRALLGWRRKLRLPAAVAAGIVGAGVMLWPGAPASEQPWPRASISSGTVHEHAPAVPARVKRRTTHATEAEQ
jgi:type IV secretion system protein VirD4